MPSRIMMLAILVVLYGLSYGEIRISQRDTVSATKQIEMLIERYGKRRLIAFILKKSGQITLDVNGKLQTFYGSPNPSYVTPQTILIDLDKVSISPNDLAKDIDLQEKDAEKQRQEASGKKESLAQQALELSGVKRQIKQSFESVDRTIDERLAAEKEKLDPKMKENLSQVMKESYAVGIIYGNFEKNFLKLTDEKTLIEVIKWYQTTLGKKISDLEVQASTEEATQEMQKYAASLQQNQPKPARIKLVQQIDQHSNGTEMAVDIIVGIVKGIVIGLDTALPEDQRSNLREIEKQIKDIKVQTRKVIQNVVLVGYLFTYRSLSDEVLQYYVQFLSSTHGRKFTGDVAKALTDAFQSASEDVGKKLGTLKTGEGQKKSPSTRPQLKGRVDGGRVPASQSAPAWLAEGETRGRGRGVGRVSGTHHGRGSFT